MVHYESKWVNSPFKYLLPLFSGTDDYFTLKLCVDVISGETCCEIDSLDSYGNNFEQGDLDWFVKSNLKNCENFQVPKGGSSRMSVTVTLSGGDAWYGEFIRVLLHTGVFYQCPVTSWIEAETRRFECYVGQPLPVSSIEIPSDNVENL